MSDLHPMVSPFSKFRRNFLSASLIIQLDTLIIADGNIAVFYWPNSPSPLTSFIDIQLVSAILCLGGFSCITLSMFGDLIISDVKILRPQTSNSNLIIAFPGVLRCLLPVLLFPENKDPAHLLVF